ncbi:MAG: hypothetical protein KAJ88_03500 [Candidatus Aenigmarchaeota archaeon]|nr:hypothetical protein [Candidatus Aenigmarchaeota archaeon]
MEKVDYNIEFAHIYSDQSELTDEQIKSAEVTKKIIDTLEKNGKSFVLTLLVDEYHPKFHKLNFNRFLKKLEALGVPPTYIGYESRMVSAAKLLLKSIPSDMKITSRFHPEIKVNEEVTYLVYGKGKKIKLKTRGNVIHFSRYTCALLSTAWVLLRFGVIQAKNAVELTGLTRPKPFAAANIINVLPRKYEGVETANKNIILATQYKKYAKNMHSEFF